MTYFANIVMCMIRLMNLYVYLFKQKTAYEMRISDWSSDVCSSDLDAEQIQQDDDRVRNPQEPEQNAAHEILLSINRMQLGCVMMMQPLSGFSMVCARRI